MLNARTFAAAALALLACSSTALGQRSISSDDGHALRGVYRSSIFDESIFEPDPIVQGSHVDVAFRRFFDDPENPIVEVRLVGTISPTTIYGIENRTGYLIDEDEYRVSTLVNFELDTPGTCYGHPPIALGFHYGNADRDLAAFDGSEDFAGPSGFLVEYGTTWASPFYATGQPEPFYLSTDGLGRGLCELVGGTPEEPSWTVLRFSARQIWAMQYSAPAWNPSPGGGHYPYGLFLTDARVRVAARLEAVHEDGSVQY